MVAHTKQISRSGFVLQIVALLVVFFGLTGVLLFYSNNNFASIFKSSKKTFVSKGANKIGFPKISFNYNSGWVAKEEDEQVGNGNTIPFNKLTIVKDDYTIQIDQVLIVGGGACWFKDSPKPGGPAIDLTNVKYKEIKTGFGTARYYLNPEMNSESQDVYNFCSLNEYEFSLSKVGYISITTPKKLDAKIFNEAIEIVKSIKRIE